jgi:hypothetical protein
MRGNIRNFTKDFLNKYLLYKMNLEIHGIAPETARSKLLRQPDIRNTVDLTDLPDIHPVSLVCENFGQRTLIRVPLNKCHHFEWSSFPCRRDSLSPFIRTIMAYEEGKCSTYQGSALEAFYQAFQPNSAAEVLGLEDLACPVLHSTPPAGTPILWRPGHPEQNVQKRVYLLTKENQLHGRQLKRPMGDKFFGPVSKQKGELEFKRLINVYEQIKRGGFKVFEERQDNIEVSFMLSSHDEDWQCRICAGQHRIAALSALGYDSAIVQIREEESLGGVIHHKDARFWPTVRHGYLTQEEATIVFDRMFQGKHQPQLRFSDGRAVANSPQMDSSIKTTIQSI